MLSSDTHIILHRALEMRFIYWECESKEEKAGVPLQDVSVSFCNIRSMNFPMHRIKTPEQQSMGSMPSSVSVPQVPSFSLPCGLEHTATAGREW